MRLHGLSIETFLANVTVIYECLLFQAVAYDDLYLSVTVIVITLCKVKCEWATQRPSAILYFSNFILQSNMGSFLTTVPNEYR
jgi:hypothetical protein